VAERFAVAQAAIVVGVSAVPGAFRRTLHDVATIRFVHVSMSPKAVPK